MALLGGETRGRGAVRVRLVLAAPACRSDLSSSRRCPRPPPRPSRPRRFARCRSARQGVHQPRAGPRASRGQAAPQLRRREAGRSGVAAVLLPAAPPPPPPPPAPADPNTPPAALLSAPPSPSSAASRVMSGRGVGSKPRAVSTGVGGYRFTPANALPDGTVLARGLRRDVELVVILEPPPCLREDLAFDDDIFATDQAVINEASR